MTNRFEYVYLDELGVNAIKDNVTGKHTPLSNNIADKLNELNDENEQLKGENKKNSQIFENQLNIAKKQYTDLLNENERLQYFESKYRERNLQLEEERKEWKKSSAYWSKQHSEVEKENEQLKQQNDKLIRLINDLGSEEMDRQMEEILND